MYCAPSLGRPAANSLVLLFSPKSRGLAVVYGIILVHVLLDLDLILYQTAETARLFRRKKQQARICAAGLPKEGAQ